jgi:pimeloyl-ACP methyl ester carboxylesterase
VIRFVALKAVCFSFSGNFIRGFIDARSRNTFRRCLGSKSLPSLWLYPLFPVSLNKEARLPGQHMSDKTVTKAYADVNGISMYYEIHGPDGTPLVLIHGGGSTIGTSFGKVLPLLAADFRVIAVELQGHGHSSDRDGPESFEQDADDVAALIHHLSVPRALFFGFSNGGHVALQLAARHPRLVAGLILASTFYKREALPAGFIEGMKDVSLEAIPLPLRQAFLAANPDETKMLAMFDKDRQRMLDFVDWEDGLLKAIEAPALIISGDRDAILPAHAVRMAALIPECRLMILPATHGSYLGVAEVDAGNEAVIRLTIQIIGDFARKAMNR